MVYLLNTNLENEKKVKIALKNIKGIGSKLACQICDAIGISDSVRINQLNNLQIEKLAMILNQKNLLGAELKRQNRKNIERLIKIACYRGFRHTEGLPCRGQRTHGNSRTTRRLKMVFGKK